MSKSTGWGAYEYITLYNLPTSMTEQVNPHVDGTHICDWGKDRGYAIVVRLLLWPLLSDYCGKPNLPPQTDKSIGKMNKVLADLVKNLFSLSEIFLNSNFVWSWSRRGDVYLTRLPIWGSPYWVGPLPPPMKVNVAILGARQTTTPLQPPLLCVGIYWPLNRGVMSKVDLNRK